MRRLALLTTPFLLFAVAIGLAPAAAAHGAEAALSVVSAEEQAGAVHYRVRVVYQNERVTIYATPGYKGDVVGTANEGDAG